MKFLIITTTIYICLVQFVTCDITNIFNWDPIGRIGVVLFYVIFVAVCALVNLSHYKYVNVE